MSLTCPNCQHSFDIIVEPLNAPRRARPTGSIDPKILRCVLEFMRELEPRRYEFRELSQAFDEALPQHPDWPAITDTTLGRALVRNGAPRWRNATQRGYDIPEVPENQEPAKPAPSVQAQIERDAYREALVAHTGMTPAELPRSSGFADIEAPVMRAHLNKQSGNTRIAQIARERLEAAERERLAELAKIHDEGVPELPPF